MQPTALRRPTRGVIAVQSLHVVDAALFDGLFDDSFEVSMDGGGREGGGRWMRGNARKEGSRQRKDGSRTAECRDEEIRPLKKKKKKRKK